MRPSRWGPRASYAPRVDRNRVPCIIRVDYALLPENDHGKQAQLVACGVGFQYRLHNVVRRTFRAIGFDSHGVSDSSQPLFESTQHICAVRTASRRRVLRARLRRDGVRHKRPLQLQLSRPSRSAHLWRVGGSAFQFVRISQVPGMRRPAVDVRYRPACSGRHDSRSQDVRRLGHGW